MMMGMSKANSKTMDSAALKSGIGSGQNVSGIHEF